MPPHGWKSVPVSLSADALAEALEVNESGFDAHHGRQNGDVRQSKVQGARRVIAPVRTGQVPRQRFWACHLLPLNWRRGRGGHLWDIVKKALETPEGQKHADDWRLGRMTPHIVCAE